MSLEDVERIMADTQDAIEYQRVCCYVMQLSLEAITLILFRKLTSCLVKILRKLMRMLYYKNWMNYLA